MWRDPCCSINRTRRRSWPLHDADAVRATETAGLRLLALNSSRYLGQPVADRLGIDLSPHEERAFEDGEHKARPLVNVRGTDVFVLHSLHADETESVNDKLCRLLYFIGALKDAAAASVTAVVPYLWIHPARDAGWTFAMRHATQST